MKPIIVFMDDEIPLLDSLKRMLRDKEDIWEIHFLDSIQASREFIQTKPVDIAVLDILMLDGNGLTLLKEIKQSTKENNVDIIMLTGTSDKTCKRQALNAGATDLLAKPVEKEDLVARIQSVLKIRSFVKQLKEKNKALEYELLKSQKMELIGLLAAGAVHDLNGLLSVIMGYTSLYSGNVSKTNTHEVNECFETIMHALGRASSITRQILDFAKNNEIEQKAVELNVIMNECIEFVKHSIPKKIKLVWLPLDSKCYTRGIPIMLYQMILNLILNARKAIDSKGEIKITLSEVRSSDNNPIVTWNIDSGPYYRIEVADTGMGMTSETVQHIFEPLYTTCEKSGGTGLGLSVVRMIVEMHKGSINVYSQEGQGTTFQIDLPKAEKTSK